MYFFLVSDHETFACFTEKEAGETCDNSCSERIGRFLGAGGGQSLKVHGDC